MNPPLFGRVDKQFQPVKEAFQALWRDHEVGAGLCIYLEGINVVDLWGGWQDRARTKLWEENTLVNIYSTSKGLIAFALARLVHTGQLDYKHRVSEYWPEFGVAGKAEITVAELLSHQAGLCAFDTPIAVGDLYRWSDIIGHLTAAKPRWKPGSQAGYHPITWGFLAGEIIRRITGMSAGSFLKTAITTPLQADCYIGLSPQDQRRCADLIGPNHVKTGHPPSTATTRSDQHPLVRETQENPVIRPYADACSAAWRSAEIPASNGHATAKGLAKVYRAALLGTHDFIGKAALSSAVQLAVSDQSDLILGTRMNRSQGGFIKNPNAGYGPQPNAFGHNGTGGSSAFADPDAGVSFAYVANQMHPEGHAPRAPRLAEVFFDCL